MTRIIGGTLSGRRLAVPARGTRPTSDRIREALFSALDSLLAASGHDWGDLAVLDCFAGSGALGIESMSRGAHRAVLIERSRPAAHTIRRNVKDLGLAGVEVVVADAHAAATVGDLRGPFGLIVADPPYETDPMRVSELIDRLLTADLLADPGLMVIEGSRRWDRSPLPPGVVEVRRRDYGDTSLWYGRRA